MHKQSQIHNNNPSKAEKSISLIFLATFQQAFRARIRLFRFAREQP
jgi:hypothetical protein